MYKSGQGIASRLGALVLILLFAMYSGYSWYAAYYEPATAYGGSWSLGGSVVLLLGGAAAAVYVALLNPRSCDFLIETDGELRKVVWPETTPVFSPRAEAWGATFVVIITVAVFGAFIWVVDTVLGWILQQGLFPLLFGTGG